MTRTLQTLIDEDAVTLPRPGPRARACSPGSSTGERPLSPASTASPGRQVLAAARVRGGRARRPARALLVSTAARSSRPRRASSRPSGRRWDRPLAASGRPHGRALGDTRTILRSTVRAARLLDPLACAARSCPRCPRAPGCSSPAARCPPAWRRCSAGSRCSSGSTRLDPAAAEELLARQPACPARRRTAIDRLRAGPPAHAPARRRVRRRAAGPHVRQLIDGLATCTWPGSTRRRRRALEAACRGAAARPTIRARRDAAGQPALAAFERCARSRSSSCAATGLTIHDTVRELAVALRSAADPNRTRRDRVAACTHLAPRPGLRAPRTAGATGRHDVPDREPGVREAFFPTGVEAYAVEPATPADRSAIGDRGAARAAGLARAPARLAARRARRRSASPAPPSGAVAAFLIVVERSEVPHGSTARTPSRPPGATGPARRSGGPRPARDAVPAGRRARLPAGRLAGHRGALARRQARLRGAAARSAPRLPDGERPPPRCARRSRRWGSPSDGPSVELRGHAYRSSCSTLGPGLHRRLVRPSPRRGAGPARPCDAVDRRAARAPPRRPGGSSSPSAMGPARLPARARRAAPSRARGARRATSGGTPGRAGPNVDRGRSFQLAPAQARRPRGSAPDGPRCRVSTRRSLGGATSPRTVGFQGRHAPAGHAASPHQTKEQGTS